MKPSNLQSLTYAHLDSYLAQFLDYERFGVDDALSGFQVLAPQRRAKRIDKIALAVDSTQEVIDAACAWDADILLVHHGLFWGKAVSLVDGMYKKIATLVQNECALCAIHLPLDAHLEIGNNAQLAGIIGLDDIHACAGHHGVEIGVGGYYKGSLEALQKHLHCECPWERYEIPCIAGKESVYTVEGIEKYYCSHARYTPDASDAVGAGDGAGVKTAIVSGGGGFAVPNVSTQGYGLCITGDASHVAWLIAQEHGMDIAFIGHYYSEVWGVLALGAHLNRHFAGVQCGFINVPSGC